MRSISLEISEKIREFFPEIVVATLACSKYTETDILVPNYFLGKLTF